MVFMENGQIGFENAPCEEIWKVEQNGQGPVLMISGAEGVICAMKPDTVDGIWSGAWLKFEQMPVRLLSVNKN